MLLSLITKNKYFIRVLFVFALFISIVVSFVALKSQLVFGFDQARDAFESYTIWHNHHFKILGPSSDIPGVHHGVVWYYFLAVIYFVAGGNPNIASIVFFIIFLLTAPLGGWIVYKIFKNITISLVFVLLYVNSPLFQLFNRWLSNPTLALILSPLILFSIYTYVHTGIKKYLFFIGLLMGLLIQADFAFGVFLPSLIIYAIYYRVKLSITSLGLFILGSSLGALSFFVAEIKFQGQTSSGLIGFLSHSFSSKGAVESFLALCNKITDVFAYTVFPFPKLLVFILLVILFWKHQYKNNKKDPLVFLLIWLSNLVLFQLFSSGFVNGYFMLAPSLFPVVAIGSYIIVTLIRKKPYLIATIVLIYCLQVVASLSMIINNYTPLAVQQGMNLSDEEKIIDYTYTSSQKKPFIITTITNPLYINTTWAYLYQFYGQNKYGYVPYFSGRSQEGYLGNLPARNFGVDNRYLIIEPLEGIPNEYIAKIIYEEDRVSDIIEQKKFGKFLVQKRIFHLNKGKIDIPQILLSHPKILAE